MTPKYEITAKKDPVFRPSFLLHFVYCRKNETEHALRMERHALYRARIACRGCPTKRPGRMTGSFLRFIDCRKNETERALRM